MSAIKIEAKARLTANWKDEVLNPKIVAAVSELEKLVKITNVNTDSYNDAEEGMAGCEVYFEGKDQCPVSMERGWLNPNSLKAFGAWFSKTSKLPGVDIGLGVGEQGDFCVIITNA